METVHATTIAIDGAGVLLRGPSASGKSDLALRLIDRGARLVADDRTVLARQGAAVQASAPRAIEGKIEVRGLGIVRLPDAAPATLRLVVDLVRPGEIERMPASASAALLGVSLPVLHLDPFEASAVAKVRLAARMTPDEVER
jgi:serine kinase of HPr protein (carbohydrate metabolism regulator)